MLKFYKKVKNLSKVEEEKYSNLEKSIIDDETFVQIPSAMVTSYAQGDVMIELKMITGFSDDDVSKESVLLFSESREYRKR